MLYPQSLQKNGNTKKGKLEYLNALSNPIILNK